MSTSFSHGNPTYPAKGNVDVDGINIVYQTYGAGPPMLLVHGWGADANSNWVDTGWVDALQAHRTLICIDVRGHGQSDKPYALEPYSYAAMSRDVLAVMEALGVEQADFMGYSMGAFMGAYLLGHHGDRFRSMVLGGIGDETADSAAQGEVIAKALRLTDLENAEPGTLAVRRFVEANPNNNLEALAFSAQKMWPQGYPRALAGDAVGDVHVPVLIVNGAEDYPYVNSADALADALWQSEHIRIPNTDHLTAVTAAEFKAAVIKFLTQ